MPIHLNNPDEIYRYETRELWNIIGMLEDNELENYKEELDKIKYGDKIKIPIIYIIKKWITEYPESKKIQIKGHGKTDIIEFYDEIDERNKLMRTIIVENLNDEDPMESRT